ncbi:SRPBCC family protein [Nocardiopsis halophila]|uniref:SRPBCC family protein n=1 Tax=Nocardiopsis halophila TaxID=141692 RepID=UPI0003472216|nr:SRPBCC family protein [Nocardiopsis halophila]
MPAQTDNRIVIDAPLDLVWEMTNDVESWPGLFTEYADAKVLERRGDTMVIRLTLHPDPDGTAWSWVSERTPDRDSLTVRAHRVETGPFEFMNLVWTYREVEGGVEMRWRQEFTMKPTAPFDDAAMTERLNRVGREQMAVIKSRIEERAASVADRG